MPPQTRVEKVRQEGHTALALHTLRQGQLSSGRAGARLYNIPKSTFAYRVQGRAARVELRANNHKLAETEEQALVRWILSMDKRGYPPRICAVRESTELLLKQRVTGPSAKIGKNWSRNFVNRQPQLKSKYSRNYDYQRAQCEDPEKLRDWFRLVGNMIRKYGIVPDDIYNFDEVGYAMGVIRVPYAAKDSQKGL
jgi:Tc5 transposase DNA-binding domain/helix-turn-helix, Psq domain